jgi:hypothetical protein
MKIILLPKCWWLFFLLIAIVWFFSVIPEANAQCAMCRATVENNANNGDTKLAAGLNSGILYLMSVPYIMLSVIGYLWYSRSRKSKNGKIKQPAKIRINGGY